MKYLQLKDQKLRKDYQKLEIKLKLNKFISHHLLSVFFKNKNIYAHKYRKIIFYNILKKKRKNILNKIVRRCIFSNRSKSLRFLRLSRLQSKELISLGIIPGYKKAVW